MGVRGLCVGIWGVAKGRALKRGRRWFGGPGAAADIPFVATVPVQAAPSSVPAAPSGAAPPPCGPRRDEGAQLCPSQPQPQPQPCPSTNTGAPPQSSGLPCDEPLAVVSEQLSAPIGLPLTSDGAAAPSVPSAPATSAGVATRPHDDCGVVAASEDHMSEAFGSTDSCSADPAPTTTTSSAAAAPSSSSCSSVSPSSDSSMALADAAPNGAPVERLDPSRVLLRRGFVPHMQVDALVYASEALLPHLLREAEEATAAASPLVQVARMAWLPGVVGIPVLYVHRRCIRCLRCAGLLYSASVLWAAAALALADCSTVQLIPFWLWEAWVSPCPATPPFLRGFALFHFFIILFQCNGGSAFGSKSHARSRRRASDPNQMLFVEGMAGEDSPSRGVPSLPVACVGRVQCATANGNLHPSASQDGDAPTACGGYPRVPLSAMLE